MKTRNALLVLLITGILLPSFSSAQIEVTGKIHVAGRGIADVEVTDGVNIAITDSKGRYKLLVTDPLSDLVYYSLPSGYQSPVVDGVPVFYRNLNTQAKRQKIDFELIPAQGDQHRHAFVVWADPQVLDKEELEQLKEVAADVKSTVDDLKQQMPVHAIAVGDLVFDRLNLFEPYKKVVATMELPFYQVIGNHDLDLNNRSDERSSDTYRSHFGPEYYSFNVGKIHYVVLKDVFYYGFSYRYMGYINERQLSWLEKDLARVQKGSTVVVALHIPTYYGESEKLQGPVGNLVDRVINNEALYKILAPYTTHIMAGHSHKQWNKIISPRVFEHVHAAASGAWWQGDICIDGTPKAYTVYTVNGDSLQWELRTFKGDSDDQFKVYHPGAEPAYPHSILANVYNYDPAWKVEWLEDGVVKGEMNPYWGIDPLARAIYAPGKNKKHSWLSASATGHLFQAVPLNRYAQLSVRVTDRFGKVITKPVPPPSVATHQAVTPAGKWKLVWHDEFDYTGLPDSTRWSYDTAGNTTRWGNNELQHYTAFDTANVLVKDGKMTISARIQEKEGKQFTSARMITRNKGDWKYGRFEIRAKVPRGKGTWPAIWMLPTDWEYGSWPASGEIDIMEYVGYEPDTIYGSAHTKTYNHTIGTQKTAGLFVKDPHLNYYVYALEWDEKEYRIFVDDTHYFTFKNEGSGFAVYPFDKRFHLLINLAIGGNWGGKYGIDRSLFPHQLSVDYVRVYEFND